MGIRQGLDNIVKRSSEIQKRAEQRNGIWELRLFGDGDIAIIRFLTDDPVDADMHEVRDTSISKMPIFHYCTYEDADECEWCEKDIARSRMFYFWIWVEKILHTAPADDGSWSPVKYSNRTYYEEKVEKVRLMRKKFGRGGAMWQIFQDMYDNYGTWMDRYYTYRRKGAPNDINTVYTLSPLDKSETPVELKRVIAKLPTLADVVMGKVNKLDEEQEGGSKGTDSKSLKDKIAEKNKVPVKKEPEPKVKVEVPEIDFDDKEENEE